MAGFGDLPIIAVNRLQREYPPSAHDAFVAITYAGNNTARRDRFTLLKSLGYRLASFVSPGAHRSSAAHIGENCFVLEGAVLQPFASVGDDVFIWSGSSICHHSTVGAHSFIAANVTVSGNVNIGECCFIGAGAVIRDGITVGDGAVVGAGALLLKDAAPDTLFIGSASRPAGIPASELKSI